MTFFIIVIIIGLVLWIGGTIAGNHFENKVVNIIESAAQKADELVSTINGFKATYATKYVKGTSVGGFIYVDSNSLQICIVPLESNKYKIFKPSDMIDVQIVENNSTISETKIGAQLGKAVVGGVLFGSVGAVVGGLSSNKKNSVIIESLQVVIHFNDFECHTIMINCLQGVNIKRSAPEYRSATDIAVSWYGVLNVFANHADVHNEVSAG